MTSLYHLGKKLENGFNWMKISHFIIDETIGWLETTSAIFDRLCVYICLVIAI